MSAVVGVAGALGVETVDGRRIDRSHRFTVRPARPLPLLAIDAPGDGHEGAFIVGQLDRVTVADGLVHVHGTAEGVPPGEYPCGMDLANTEHVLLVNDDTLLTDVGLIGMSDEDYLTELTTAGELIGVTLYLPGSRQAPAFPQAWLVVS